MKLFTRAERFATPLLLQIVAEAARMKSSKTYPELQGKILGNVFFNPSLRTKLSFETAMLRSGGTALSISPGGGTWSFEGKFGVRMDQDRPEHLKEAVRVMSRYVDALGARSFAGLQSAEEDAGEQILSAFEEYATVPVISLESALEHPCQMVADMLTIEEILGDRTLSNQRDLPRENQYRGRNFCLRWAPHIKPLPLAVPHSSILAAAHLGMNITVAAPDGYELDERYVQQAREIACSNGGSYSEDHEPDALPENTEILSVKSWGARSLYGKQAQQAEELRKLSPWMVRESIYQKNTHLLHCLPVRRNVVITDKALDHPRSKIIDQAENRLWGQLAVLQWLFEQETRD
ncbi:N-acetylornithine carbamoyltransferase [bacterium]|nr:N-acetylornithine carbamoyltransferase [bacterium]